MILVKICGITNLEDAIQAVEAGAGALGFNFWPGSPRHTTQATARRIAAQLPSAIMKVGVFVDEPASAEIARLAGMDIAQLHGGPDPEAIPFWRALPANTPQLRATMETSPAEAFLIDTPAGEQRGGTGRTFDWSLACGLPGRVVLAGGLSEANVAEAIRTAKPWGVDACSRLEREPGKKDHAKVAEFIRAVRQTEL